MPYSFVEIEKHKTWQIQVVFVFLLVFYFIAAQLLWIVTRFFFSGAYTYAAAGIPVLSLRESVFVFLVSLAVAYIHWYFSTRNMVGDILNLLDASRPDPRDSYHKMFRNVVDEVSVATGGIRIDAYVIPVSGMNAFAVSDGKGNAVIGITEGLLSRLTRSQLEAVVGHEAAHIASGDSFSTTLICSLFGVYAAILSVIDRMTLRDSSDRSDTGVSIGARFGAYLVVVYFILLAVKGINYMLNIFISRQREYRADAVAVKLTRDPLALAESLYIISRGWRGLGAVPQALSPIFIMNTGFKALDESDGFFQDMFSTHPPIKRRLKVLLDMAHCDTVSPASVIKSHPGPFPRISGAGESNKCPRCFKPLTEVLYEGAPAMSCGVCGGISSKRDAVARILARENYSFPKEVKDMADSLQKVQWLSPRPNFYKIQDPLDCPYCGKKMSRGFFSYGLPVEVDRCINCGGIWFDRGELEMLQYLIEKNRLVSS